MRTLVYYCSNCADVRAIYDGYDLILDWRVGSKSDRGVLVCRRCGHYASYSEEVSKLAGIAMAVRLKEEDRVAVASEQVSGVRSNTTGRAS